MTSPAVVAPAAIIWCAMAAYVVVSARASSRATKDISAQLTRREIELGRTSTIDELTGLATRREFDAMVRLEFGRFQRHRHPTSLLMVDIDDYSGVDERGPLTRSLMVAELSSVLKAALRAIDLGCRYTDTSLAMLLLETNAEQSQVVADRVRAAVAGYTFLANRNDGSLKLTVSQGIAVMGTSMASHLDFVRTAERALAEARSTGGDQARIIYADDDELAATG